MGLPEVTINFKTLGTTAIKRGERGIILAILKDDAANGAHILTSATEIPTDLSEANKKVLEMGFIGNVTAPLRVLVYVLPTDAENYTEALTWAETKKYDYLVIPDIANDEINTINSWVATQRENDKLIRFISPNNKADKHYIYNLTTASIKDSIGDISTGAMCMRIAGIIAGTPLTMAITYATLNELESVESKTRTEIDKAIDGGELVLFHDGEKVKIARGVTSLTTTTPEKGKAFKKIKIVEIMDLISSDITKTIHDEYIGKVSNSYDNKGLLCVAIKGYLQSLEQEGLLEKNQSYVDIDIEAQKVYLQSQGIDTSQMSDQAIKQHDTDDKVFIAIQCTILDSMEDFVFNITI